MKYSIMIAALLAGTAFAANAQQAKPEDTEIWDPVPKVVTPGEKLGEAPSDAVILFDGKNLDEWVQADDQSPAKWTVHDGILTVDKHYGNIETKKSFTNYQLHIEWREPTDLEGTGQARGNSGVFLASLGKGDAGYELQVLDPFNNKTYVNGMAGSLYKQAIPLANPGRKDGEWQVYDIVWTGPTFNDDGSLKSPAKATVFFNGVVVENNFELIGPTLYIGKPSYNGVKGGPHPVKLQAHGDKSKPLSFRNIWIREI